MTTALKGGGYKAVKEKDGTWTLKDVPIFAENERMLRLPDGTRIKKKYDKAWLESAVEHAQERYAANGNVAPVHYRHLEGGKTEAPLLGFVLPTGVREIPLGKGRKWAVVGDIMGLKDKTFSDVKDLNLPYRSAETTITTDPAISSLALLSSEPSYFPFALTTVGEETVAAFSRAGKGPVLCYSGRDGIRAVLTQRFEMPDSTTTDENTPKVTATWNDGTTQTGTLDVATGKWAFPPKDGEGDGNPKPPSKDGADGGDGAGDAKDEGQQDGGGDSAKLDAILVLLRKLVGVPEAGVAGAAPAAGTEGVATMSKGTDDTAAAGASSGDVAKFQADLAEQKGIVAALRGQVDAFASEKAQTASLEKARKRLRGFNIPKVEEEILAAFKDGGEKALDRFCLGVEKAGVREPTAEWAEGEEDAKNVPADLAKFSALGGDAVKAARDAGAEYDGLHPAFKKSSTKDEHVLFTLRRRGFDTSALNGSK